jgi:hypothetical protein
MPSIQGSSVGCREFKITLSYDDNNEQLNQMNFYCTEDVWYETFYFYDKPSYEGFIKTIEFANAGIKGRSFSYTISPEVDKSTLTIKTNGIIYNDVITLYR